MAPRFFLLCLCALVLCGASEAGAQTALLRGFVTDGATGQPLQGASVVLNQQGEFIAGAATGRDGLFVISALPPGQYILRISYIGYAVHRDTLRLSEDEVQTLNVTLTTSEALLDEVVVETGETGAAAVTAGRTRIRPADVQRIPSISATPDLVDYLTTLPGVVATGDQGGQLYIRGGTNTQNLFLVDGMLVYQPLHLVGYSSIFPADLISKADLYAGGFGARYGRRLSSVIDVALRNGNKKKFAGAASVDPLLAAVQVEGPVLKDVSVLVSLRRSLIRHSAPLFLGQSLPYTFGDELIKAHAILSKNKQLSVTYTHSYDKGTIGAKEDAPLDEEIRWDNMAVGSRFLYLPGELPILTEYVLSYSRFTNAFEEEGRPLREASAWTAKAFAHLTYFLRNAEVRAGLFLGTSKLNYLLTAFFQDVSFTRYYQTLVGGYLGGRFMLGDHLTVYPGLRIDGYPSSRTAYVEPRVRAEWETPFGRINGAVGLYHQEVVGLRDERDSGNVFTAWVVQPVAETTPSAWHFILGGSNPLTRWLTVSAEGYYKHLSNLYLPEWNAFPAYTTRLQSASGRVFGLDLRAEVQKGPFYGYAGYGYSNTVYTARQESLLLYIGKETEQFSPPHDRRHNLNVLGQLTWKGFDFSARWQFGSGFPYTDIRGFDDWVMMSHLVDVEEITGSYRVIFDRRYRERLPAYHRLDLSVARTFLPRPDLEIMFKAGAINAYNRRNLYYYDFFEFRRVDQLPLIPSLSLRVEFR